MSYLLDSINQIRFPSVEGPFGYYTLIINRPGFFGVTIAAANTLQLMVETDPSYPNRVSPHLMDEIPLSKKFTTTVGRRALDDASIPIRDSIGYSGIVDGSPQSEQFDVDFLTFFDVWFSHVVSGVRIPYTSQEVFQAIVQSTNFLPDNSMPVTNVAHMGYIDPTYNPSSDADIINPGTSSQIWIGTRTIKITALSQAQLSLTWLSVLLPYDANMNPYVPSSYAGIQIADCQEGLPYNGFMFAPPNCSYCSNTRQTAFGGGLGSWYQAVPHYHLNGAIGGTGFPFITPGVILVRPPAAVWPVNPWSSSLLSGQISQLANAINPSSGYAVFVANGIGATPYAPGDKGVVNYEITDPGGGILATYVVTAVLPGGLTYEQIVFFQFTNAGSNYAVDTSGNSHTTTATTGTGSGMTFAITKVMTGANFGPSGLVFISVGTIFAKVAQAMGLDTFDPSTDLNSALSFWTQSAIETGGQACFPLDVTRGAIPLDQLYVSLNVFAQCHPFDGSLWGNPAGFAIDTAILDVVSGICNFLLVDFNEVYSTSGVEKLQLTPFGTTTGSVPASFEIIGAPDVDDPTQGPTNAVVNYRGDNLQIQCPISDKGQSSNIEIPIRLHRIGNTSGNNPVNDLECVTWDGNDFTVQADNCFKIAWFDSNNIPTVNPDCWKGLCYLYWFNASNTNVVYPSTWPAFVNSDGSAGSWANSFYVVNAQYNGTPIANLQSVPQGNDYFNARCYQSVAFAQLELNNGTVQTFQYSGISDDSGSIQAITSGLAGTWRLGPNASQNWRGTQVDQLLRAGTTSIKWQIISSSGAFPNLTDLTYGVVGGGGTSSSVGGNTQTGGQPNGNNPSPSTSSTIAITISSNVDNYVLPTIGTGAIYFITLAGTDPQTWRMSGIAGGTNGMRITLVNVSTGILTLSNMDIASTANNQFFTVPGTEFKLMPGATQDILYNSTMNKWTIPGFNGFNS